ncbi:hypothetical protein HOK51_07405 [Candidatus Woesearchaeota archaeon]|jgi:hypothetical protein|nr:hypothetical protein [Candidatus Woesearchaeota archaeon]MBT6519649.1 hypothetical protein [Candidatus Woesearchaeota archaeon]
MDAKTKTRTDKERKPYTGETQVRELGDVLQREEPRQEYKDELEETLDKFGYQEFVQINELKNKLYEILHKKNYLTTELKINSKEKSYVNIHTKTNKDKTIEILVEHELTQVKRGDLKPGYTYLKFDKYEDAAEFEAKYANLISKPQKQKITEESGMAIMSGGIIGLFSSGIALGIAGEISISLVGIVTLIGIISTSSINMYNNLKIRINDTKELEEIREIGKKSTLGKDAIKNAIYGRY